MRSSIGSQRATLVVFPFDQHARPPDGIAVDFFGQPAGTFKSLAIIALATGAPVLPAASWREPDGWHVLRFEDPVPPVECDNVNEEIRRNTRAYNAVLERLILRHPEQWFWVHRRWKSAPTSVAQAGANRFPERFLRNETGYTRTIVRRVPPVVAGRVVYARDTQ